MRGRRAFTGALAFLVACGPAAPPASPPAEPTVGAEVGAAPGPGWAREDDPLAARARSLAARLEALGARPDEGVEARFFLAARGTRALEVEVPPGACRVLAAFASRGMRALDARLFTPEGELVGEDDGPEPQPVVVVCGDELAPTRLWWVLDARDGSGSVLAVALAVPRGEIRRVADALGRDAAVVPDASPPSELERWLRGRGFERFEPLVSVALAPGQAVRVPLRARAGRCYAVVARPRPPLATVALRLVDLAGAPLVDGDPTALALQRCEPSDVERAIEVSAPEGGTVELVVAEGEEARVGGTPGLWLGVLPRGEETSRSAVRVRAARATGALARGETARHAIRVDEGCVRVSARPVEGTIARLSVEVSGVPGGAGDDRPSAVERCGRAAMLDVRVTALGGAGSYVVDVEPVEPR